MIDLCPPVACFGVNCTIVTESNGCKTCACPIGMKKCFVSGLMCLYVWHRVSGSRARGCDQMPVPLFQELMEGGCPDPAKPYAERPHPKMVFRWFRHVSHQHQTKPVTFLTLNELYYKLYWYRFFLQKSSTNSIDECRSYLFPYCQKSDYNLWRSPLTVTECELMCYTDVERRKRRR